MSEQDHDGVASTQMFQAFVEKSEREAAPSRTAPLAVALAVVAGLLVVGALAWFSLTL